MSHAVIQSDGHNGRFVFRGSAGKIEFAPEFVDTWKLSITELRERSEKHAKVLAEEFLAFLESRRVIS
jgi:hypothetical protein